MMFKTHLAFGLLIAIIILNIFNITSIYLFIFTILFGSMFLDIDTFRSKIGRKFKPVSFILNLMFGHRGFIHTVYLPLIIFILSVILNKSILGFGFLLGYFSHLVLDSLSLEGIRPFTPLSRFRVNGFIRTNSFSEYLLLVVILILIIYFSGIF